MLVFLCVKEELGYALEKRWKIYANSETNNFLTNTLMMSEWIRTMGEDEECVEPV